MMRTDKPCVRIVEDEPAVSRLFSLMMETHGFESRCYASAELFISDDELSDPGCVLVDLGLQGISGIDLVGWIDKQPNHPPAIVITGRGSAQSAVECMKNGALDFVEKPVNSPALMELVRCAVELDAKQRATRLPLAQLQGYFATLTPREVQVMVGLSEGLSTKQIAGRLDIAPKTAEHHRDSVMKKMHASSFAHLVKSAVELGL